MRALLALSLLVIATSSAYASPMLLNCTLTDGELQSVQVADNQGKIMMRENRASTSVYSEVPAEEWQARRLILDRDNTLTKTVLEKIGNTWSVQKTGPGVSSTLEAHCQE